MGCLSSRSVQVVSRKPTPVPPTPSPPPRTPTPPPPPRQNTEDFNSDAVDIKYDDRVDQESVPVQNPGDPAPCPIDTENNNICKSENHFFDDEEYQLSSDDADIRETETGQDDVILPDDDTKSVAISLLKKQPGKRIPKISFAAIDEHARNAKDVHAESFESLKEYLTSSLDGEHSELLTARAIVVWLSQQEVDKGEHGEPDLQTPKGLLQCLRKNIMTYATCYVILCRSAGLKCSYINGIVKAAGYEPGVVSAPHSPWTAVYADGAWRIVHPFWVCRALFGHSLAGWVKVEQDGTSTAQRTHASKGVARNAFQEHYFMPKPEHFVHKCFPDDKNWQLLPKKMMVKTEKDFFEMPLLFPPFFGLGLELTSDQKCQLESSDGTCRIQIKAKGSNGHMIVLGYELFVKESEDTLEKKTIHRMVFNSRSNEYFIFDIRFPIKGVFKLVLYGGPYKSPLLRLCEFKITCKQAMSGINLLPLSCGNLGWGPGPATEEAGLILPSRPNGKIAVAKDRRTTAVSFTIMKKFLGKSIYTAMLSDGSDEADEDKFARCVSSEEYTESKKITISVSLPREGEFGLRIISQTSGRGRVICNYLLSTVTQKRETTAMRIAKQKLLETVRMLETETNHQEWTTKLDQCKSGLEKCRKQKVDPSDEELCLAETTIELYTYKNYLRDSMIRRNVRVIHVILQLASNYKNKVAIEDEARRVEHFRDILKALRKCASEAAGLRDAFGPLVMDNEPPGEVLTVYRALLCLLGTSTHDLKSWDTIQRKMGDDESIVRRLQQIHATDIDKVTRVKVGRELEKVTKDALKRDHEHAYALFNWIKTVLNIYNPKH